MHKQSRRAIALLCCTALLATGLAGCGKSEEAVMDSTVVVDTQKAEVGAIALSGSYVGTVSAAQTVNVVPLVSGTVKDVYVSVGSTVKEGDKLCQFDDTTAKLTLASAQAGYNQAQAAAQSTLGGSWNLTSYQTQAGIETTQKAVDQLNETVDELNDKKSDLKDTRNKAKDAMETAQKASGAAAAASTMGVDIAARYAAALAAESFNVTITEANQAALEALGITGEIGSVVSVPGKINTVDGLNKAVALGAETATALQGELTAAGITVEQLTPDKLKELADAATAAAEVYKKAAEAYGNAETAYQTIKSNTETAENSLENTQKQLETTQGVQAITNSQVYSDTVNSLSKSLATAQVGVDSANYQVSLYKVTSPISGVVESVGVTPNNLFGSGSVAFTISNQTAKNITFYVTEEVAKQLSSEQSVTITRGNDHYNGTITEIGAAVDPTKGLFKVKATVYNAPDLSNGITVELSTTTHVESGCIVVPSDSVYYQSGNAYVYVVQDGTAHQVPVETGIYDEASIVIRSGLNVGDEVITTWSPGLSEGTPVMIAGEAAAETPDEAESQAE